MKFWIDDMRPAPKGYHWYKTVNAVKRAIRNLEFVYQHTHNELYRIELIDMDHDAGDYARCGGDYIELLNWLEETGRSYPIRIHSMNPVGADNLRRIIEHNGWKEVK